jgi:hypothetical protein
MATAGVIIASTVAEEEDTSPAVETAVNVLMPPIVEAGHRQYALGAADPTVLRPYVPPMPPQHVVARPMVPLMPQQHVVVRLMAPLMPQQHVVVRLTAAVADRMVAANTTSQ